MRWLFALISVYQNGFFQTYRALTGMNLTILLTEMLALAKHGGLAHHTRTERFLAHN
jgi:hypothetical protein